MFFLGSNNPISKGYASDKVSNSLMYARKKVSSPLCGLFSFVASINILGGFIVGMEIVVSDVNW